MIQVWTLLKNRTSTFGDSSRDQTWLLEVTPSSFDVMHCCWKRLDIFQNGWFILRNGWRFQNEFRWFSWIRPFKAVSLGCVFFYMSSDGSTWSTKSHSSEWKVPMFSMNKFPNMKIPNLFNSIQVSDILPIGSNPFCKWFWSGFWVPKHFLTGYLEH